MGWVSLTADMPLQALELAESLLYDAGASGLELRDGSVPLMPNVRAPKAGEAIVVAYFEQKKAAQKGEAALKRAVPSASVLIEAVPDTDWSSEWKQRIRAVTVGRLWVGPPWDEAKAPKELVKLVIEPKMAFGTGDHPTTSLCLAAVDEFMSAHPKATVLDVGTGTGVLALAAKKLGASRVVGTDNDPVSVELANENAAVNSVEGCEFSGKTLKQVKGSFDLVVANILANTLIELAPLIAPKVKKRLVLAGVLVPQRQSVAAAFVKQGLTELPGVEQGEWVRLDFVRR